MLQPVSPDSTITLVSIHDPAIDPDKSKVDKYRKIMPLDPGAWREHIKPLDGQRLTEFVCGVIPSAELCRIESEHSILSRWPETRWQCFLNGIRDINDGWVEFSKVERGGIEYIDPKQLSKMFIGKLRDDALFIGEAIYFWNRLLDDEVKQ